ncbi:hypothetical protein BC829DRAFT_255313 [Chytridium lagenaria]|nr:hypothetical protein BC829DRAFT_255313 [Chytridium lagenaria]
MKKAVRMLFSAANKWAREDTCSVVFTMSDSLFYRTLEKFVKRDILACSRVYETGPLTRSSADRLLINTIDTGKPLTETERASIIDTIGTRISDLLVVCEEVNKTGRSVPVVLEAEKARALETVARAISELSHAGNASCPVPKPVLRNLLKFLDERVAALPASFTRMADEAAEGKASVQTLVSVNQLWDDARQAGVKELLDGLVDINILSFDGSFSSTLLRNAYRSYRKLDKRGHFW